MTAPAVDEEVNNMIYNGTFDNSDGWTIAGNWTISDGIASYDVLASNYIGQAAEDMNVAIEASTSYIITIPVTIAEGEYTGVSIGNSNYSVIYGFNTQYSEFPIIVAFTTPSDIGVGGICIRASSSSSTASWSMDNITLVLDE